VNAPGVIRHHFGNGLIIGEPSGADSPRVQALAALLQRAGFAATVSPQIQKDIWFKLWGNMTVNPISAFTGATTDRILNDDLVRGFVSAVMLEAKDIGARIGIPIDQQPEDRHAVTRKLGAFKTSMLQDVEAGKAGGAGRAGHRGARAGPEDGRAHPLHRRAAGPGAGACAGAWAVLKFDLVP
jgi:2-dehydropantoate 2-reductase